jgi:MinD-like ATPase involved in chromosome partitioning or flagellar assembly
MYQLPRLRLALGLGDQELEQRLRPALDAADDLVVVAQSLAADQLLQVVESRHADAAVVAWSLHRLSDAVLDQLDRSGLPVVLLVPDPEDERWRARRGPVLPLDADAATIREVVLAARRGERLFAKSHTLLRPIATEPVTLKAADAPEGPPPGIIAVAGGMGSPGRTTVAINLAAALGAAAPTVLVEADLCAPALAGYLDRDPSRNLCTLAHAVREEPRAWGPALADELQPLARQSPLGVVLCGPPKREMRTSIAPAFLERLLVELAHRYQYVVVDVGPDLLGMETAAATHRAALASAHHVLLVSASDLVGLWHARTALDQFERQLGIDRRSVNLILNRYDARYHHGRSEVEWHLGAPIAAVVPFDHQASQQAIAEQRPLVVDPTSRASRALIGLAERVHDGKLRLPIEPARRDRSEPWWRRVLPRARPTVSMRPASVPESLPFAVAGERRSRAW